MSRFSTDGIGDIDYATRILLGISNPPAKGSGTMGAHLRGKSKQYRGKWRYYRVPPDGERKVRKERQRIERAIRRIRSIQNKHQRKEVPA